MVLKLLKEKKLKLEKSEAEQFYKVHETNHFIMIYVNIYHQVQ